jgi:pilus assembly protein CpaE
MNPQEIAGTLDFLRGEYDYIVVDCPRLLTESNLAIIAAASQVYVVATPEISAIRDLSRYVDDLVHADNVNNKVKVVLNRYSSQFAVSTEYIEKAIRLPVSYCIPNSYVELVRSANIGIPVSVSAHSAFTEEMRKWADTLVGVPQPAPQIVGKSKTSSVFGFLDGKFSRKSTSSPKEPKTSPTTAPPSKIRSFAAERKA